jgi:hypothetical protein
MCAWSTRTRRAKSTEPFSAGLGVVVPLFVECKFIRELISYREATAKLPRNYRAATAQLPRSYRAATACTLSSF